MTVESIDRSIHPSPGRPAHIFIWRAVPALLLPCGMRPPVRHSGGTEVKVPNGLNRNPNPANPPLAPL